MKISELIAKLEQQGNFKDDPEVVVGIRDDVYPITAPRQTPAGAVLDVVYTHTCPTHEPAYRYYWNGKLLDDMGRDELQAALVMMLDKQPVAKISVKGPSENKPVEGAKTPTGEVTDKK